MAKLLRKNPKATDYIVRYTNVWPPNNPLDRYIRYDRPSKTLYESKHGGADWVYRGVTPDILVKLAKVSYSKYVTVEELETMFGCKPGRSATN